MKTISPQALNLSFFFCVSVVLMRNDASSSQRLFSEEEAPPDSFPRTPPKVPGRCGDSRSQQLEKACPGAPAVRNRCHLATLILSAALIAARARPARQFLCLQRKFPLKWTSKQALFPILEPPQRGNGNKSGQ